MTSEAATNQDVESPVLVTVLITTKDRPDDLRYTLSSLKQQVHRSLEIIVIDDGSEPSLAPLLGREFPEVVFIRHERSRGLIAARSIGFTLAKGRFLVSLDDDANFCDANAICLAVDRMEQEKDIGVIAFRIIESKARNRDEGTSHSSHYTHLFPGSAHMFRRQTVLRVGGYMDCFEYGAEEEEYSLRVLDDGWKVLYFPDVIVDHRQSPIGRRRGKILAYTFRNAVWTLFLRTPIPHAVIHSGWKTVLHLRNTIREAELGWFLWSIWACLKGLPRIIWLRHPVRTQTFLIARLLRRRRIRTAHDFQSLRQASIWRLLVFLIR